MRVIHEGIVVFLMGLLSVYLSNERPKQPNIIIIVADDLGFNDVSYRGSNQIPTPNIDALAYNGIILDRFYTEPTCTPSRASLLIGQHPSRYGFQGYPLKGGENKFLPLDTPLLSEYLRSLNYSTHLVGKWHLGHAYRNVTPTFRGFDSHYGYWNGYIGYFSHNFTSQGASGLDFRDDLAPTNDRKYMSDLLTERAVQVIRNHDLNSDKPLFLMLAHLAPHSGDRFLMEVVDVEENDRKFGYIRDVNRRRLAGMIEKLDESVGAIVKALDAKDILDNSVILFLSDNGGETISENKNYGSNWPLRGQKFTTFEGGIRTPSILYTPYLKRKIYNHMIHITDILPTLLHIAGANVSDLTHLDGYKQWEVIGRNLKPTRKTALVGIDETQNVSAILGHYGRFKLVNGTFQNGSLDQYYGEAGRGPENPKYSTRRILNTETNQILSKMRNEPITIEDIIHTRKRLDLNGCRNETMERFVCKGFCLFDLQEDPCETTDVSDVYPTVVKELKVVMSKYWATLVPRPEFKEDPRADPVHFNGTWCTWLDTESSYCHYNE